MIVVKRTIHFEMIHVPADCLARLLSPPLPGVFCAGEMLDWEAPTGGYLLTACFASGRVAGLGVIKWIENMETAV